MPPPRAFLHSHSHLTHRAPHAPTHPLPARPQPDALLAMIGEYEGLIVRSGTTVTKEVMAAG